MKSALPLLPVGVGDAPCLHISTSPGGRQLRAQLQVPPCKLKRDWKAGMTLPETGATKAIREGQRRLRREEKKEIK